jgi:hypothetical protein
MRHQNETKPIQKRAAAQHAHAAETIGDDAAERLADAPQQVLQRQRKSKYVAAPMIGIGERGQEKAKRGARPKRDQRNQAAEADDQRRRAPADQSLAGSYGLAGSDIGSVVHVALAEPKIRKPRSIEGQSG